MSSIKNKLIVGIVALALVLVVGVFVADQTVKADVGNGIALNLTIGEVKDLACAFGVSTACEVSLGSQPGPDSFNNLECHNGVCLGYVGRPMAASSSVFCYLPNPSSASSSLKRISLGIENNTFGQAQVLYISTTTNALSGNGSATTGGAAAGSSTPSLIAARLVAANEKAQINWIPTFYSTTTNGISTTAYDVFVDQSVDYSSGATNSYDANLFEIGPSEGVVFMWATDTAGSFASYPTGACQMETAGINTVQSR